MEKIIYFILILLVSINLPLSGQPKRSDVLVFGGTAAGTGAAIQAAHSGVKVVLVEISSQLGNDMTTVDTNITVGLQKDFYQLYLKGATSAATNATIASTLFSWTDTVTNLDVFLNTGVTSIKKKGKGWRVRFSNGSKMRVHSIVDATADRSLAGKLNVSNESLSATTVTNGVGTIYANNQYRTHVAVAGKTAENDSVPIRTLIPTGVQNLILLPRYSSTPVNISNLTSGQAAGAIAAYLAFFKTSTNNMNIRVVQGELLNYRSSLLNFRDIGSQDTNRIAIEHIGATGILKGTTTNGQLLFHPDLPVSVDEIRSPFKEYYSRSQIWFADHKTNTMTINDLLSLIKFAGTRGEELNRDVERNWKTTFGFKTSFDLKRTATRREFAVLVNQYLKPFNVRVDFTGRALY